MAEQSKDILSEYTKDMTPEQREELQEKVSNMTEEELKEFRNSLDPDSMGFFGEERFFWLIKILVDVDLSSGKFQKRNPL